MAHPRRRAGLDQLGPTKHYISTEWSNGRRPNDPSPWWRRSRPQSLSQRVGQSNGQRRHVKITMPKLKFMEGDDQ